MAIGDVKHVVMDEDLGIPGGVATLNEYGILEEGQRPNPAMIGAAPEGLVHGVYSYDGTDENLIDIFETTLAEMSNRTERHIIITASSNHPVIGGKTYMVWIFKATARNASVRMWTYDSVLYQRNLVDSEWSGFLRFASEIGTARGIYTGTGGYGSGSPTSLTFDFVPKFVAVAPDLASATTGGVFFIYGQTASCGLGNNPAGSSSNGLTISWSGNSASWYSTASAEKQMNTSGTTYYYFSIG